MRPEIQGAEIGMKSQKRPPISVAFRECLQNDEGASHMCLEAGVPARTPRYARFTRRLRGIMIDWIVAMILLFGALLVASSMRSDHFARTLGILFVIVLV
jgi:hypothetical protein